MEEFIFDVTGGAGEPLTAILAGTDPPVRLQAANERDLHDQVRKVVSQLIEVPYPIEVVLRRRLPDRDQVVKEHLDFENTGPMAPAYKPPTKETWWVHVLRSQWGALKRYAQPLGEREHLRVERQLRIEAEHEFERRHGAPFSSRWNSVVNNLFPWSISLHIEIEASYQSLDYGIGILEDVAPGVKARWAPNEAREPELLKRLLDVSRSFFDVYTSFLAQQRLVYYPLGRKRPPRLFQFQADAPAEALQHFRLTATPHVVLPAHPVAQAIGLLLSDRHRWVADSMGTLDGRFQSWTVTRTRPAYGQSSPTQDESHDPEDQRQPDVGLLKVHLDLINQAYLHAPVGTPFEYDLREALERLGHRRQSHGAFNTSTLREHYSRLLTLERLFVRVSVVEGGEAERATDAPIWSVQDPGGTRGRGRPGSRRHKESALPRVPTTLMIQPGTWWQFADVPTHHVLVPQRLLTLPVYGHGNKTTAIAIMLATELAVWERRGASEGARFLERPVGELLAGAGVATLKQLEPKECLRAAKRLRAMLATADALEQVSDASTAFGILRAIGAFEIDVAPGHEDAFLATGRNWLKRFWRAKVRLQVRRSSASMR